MRFGSAVRGTPVAARLVPVVAILPRFLDAVAAYVCFGSAGCGAAVSVRPVSVITLFPIIHDGISAVHAAAAVEILAKHIATQSASGFWPEHRTSGSIQAVAVTYFPDIDSSISAEIIAIGKIVLALTVATKVSSAIKAQRKARLASQITAITIFSRIDEAISAQPAVACVGAAGGGPVPCPPFVPVSVLTCALVAL